MTVGVRYCANLAILSDLQGRQTLGVGEPLGNQGPVLVVRVESVQVQIV